MNSPSAALRQLYRHAATPARWLARLRQADTLIERFEFDLRRAGLEAEVALQALLTPVSLDAALGTLRQVGSTPAASGSDRPDLPDTPLPVGRRAGLDQVAAPDRQPAALLPTAAVTAPVRPRQAGTQPVATAGSGFDPQSHPRLALLQTQARIDLPSLQRRYGLTDTSAPDTAASAPNRALPAPGARLHSAADAQLWLRALAQRAQAPDAADQPLAARARLNGRADDAGQSPVLPPDLPRTDRAADRATSAAASHPAAAHPEPQRTGARDAGAAPSDLPHLRQQLNPTGAVVPYVPSAGAALSTAAAVAAAALPHSPALDRRTGTSPHASTWHPAAATAAALRTGSRTDSPRSAMPDPSSDHEATAGRRSAADRQDSRTPALRQAGSSPASASPVWSAPIGGFRGLAALGRAAETAPAATPAGSLASRPPFDPGADTPRDGIDAEQFAELLRQQARRHGIDLTEFEP